MDLEKLIDPVIEIAHKAGNEIIKYYRKDYEVKYKSEIKNAASIVTEVDYASDRIICQALAELTPNISAITEENVEQFKNKNLTSDSYWCIDPLDGTKIFTDKKDEFSVLIALIQNGKPVLGVNHAPALGKTYYAAVGYGAYVLENGEREKINIKKPPQKDLTALVYSVGDTIETEKITKLFPTKTVVVKNTALRDALIAEQKFDLFCYALKNAGEWDTAANEIILKEAGGFMCNKHGKAIQYGDPYHNKTSIVSLNHPNLVKYLK